MSFQWVIDNAESISINNLRQTASTTARDGSVKIASRGYQPRRIEVKVPDGILWETIRSYINDIEQKDRISTEDIQFNNSGYDWMFAYQGDYTNLTAISGGVAEATIVNGSATITLTNSGTLTSGQFKFKKGDFVQLGTDSVYTVTQDVAYNSNSVVLNRPVVEADATGVVLQTGENCVFTVRCINFPQWTIYGFKQVAWSGPFVFVEE